jgi:hypothetical protein
MTVRDFCLSAMHAVMHIELNAKKLNIKLLLKILIKSL